MEIEQSSERFLVAAARSLQQVIGHGGFTVFHAAHRFQTAWLANHMVRLLGQMGEQRNSRSVCGPTVPMQQSSGVGRTPCVGAAPYFPATNP